MAGMQNQQQAKEQQQSSSHPSIYVLGRRKKRERSCFTPSSTRKPVLDVSVSLLPLYVVGRIALVDPAKARSIEDRIIVLAQQGNIGTVYFRES